MIIDHDIRKFVVFSEQTVQEALQRIANSKTSIIFATDQYGVLEGLFTNGDFLRWSMKNETIDLRQPLRTLLNSNYVFATTADSPTKISELLDKVLYVPIVDERRHLVAVARARDASMSIAGVSIGEGEPVFIIAEIGINHNGSLETAKRLIEAAAQAGATCAKFQMRHLEELYLNAGDANDQRENLGSQYTLDLLTRFQLTDEEMIEAFDYCIQLGIIPLCTPWDARSVNVLEEYGMAGYKIASADLTNHDLIEKLASTGKPLICSTGMSIEREITETVQLLKSRGAQYALLHCNSAYPPPFTDLQLRYMSRLKEIGECPIGYSGHERGINVVMAAVAMGATIIEKHITLDRGMEGNDHKVSLLPQEFAAMVEGIQQVQEALGKLSSDGYSQRIISQGEVMNRVTLAKSVIAKRTIAAGEIIQADMLDVKSPGRGLQPNRKRELIGRRSHRTMQPGDFFFPSDLTDEAVIARPYSFDRAWGVPVRYHDYKTLMAKSNPDFLEFHLSYKDMDVDIDAVFEKPFDLDLVVHSPDLFTGDHLLNLCHPDPAHCERSQMELQRVIDITRNLKRYFKRAGKVLIIASLGGYTIDALLPQEELPALYAQVAERLAQLDTEGVEIIPQTLPPFPWYFGGQLYLNLFVDAESTAKFCRDYGYRVCFDISHSKMACNQFGWSFDDLVNTVAPHAAHLHITDAEGTSGEGLQIGDGEIDFVTLGAQLKTLAPTASFIPEIWQGHENEGEGFWKALDRLEKLL